MICMMVGCVPRDLLALPFTVLEVGLGEDEDVSSRFRENGLKVGQGIAGQKPLHVVADDTQGQRTYRRGM